MYLLFLDIRNFTHIYTAQVINLSFQLLRSCFLNVSQKKKKEKGLRNALNQYKKQKMLIFH